LHTVCSSQHKYSALLYRPGLIAHMKFNLLLAIQLHLRYLTPLSLTRLHTKRLKSIKDTPEVDLSGLQAGPGPLS